MITARDLKHHRLLFGDIDPGYIFSGMVKGTDFKTVDVSWNNVEVGHKRRRSWENVGKKHRQIALELSM